MCDRTRRQAPRVRRPGGRAGPRGTVAATRPRWWGEARAEQQHISHAASWCAYRRINYNAPLPIIRQTLYRFKVLYIRSVVLARVGGGELPSRVLGAESRGRCWRAHGVCTDPCAVPQAASLPTGRPLNPRAISSRMTTGGHYCPASAATRLLGSARRALLQRLRPHADLRLEQLGLGLHLGVSKAHGAGPQCKDRNAASPRRNRASFSPRRPGAGPGQRLRCPTAPLGAAALFRPRRHEAELPAAAGVRALQHGLHGRPRLLEHER